MEKRCKYCQQVKPLESFYKHPKAKDGRDSKCIECAKTAVRKNRIEKIEYYRSFDKMRASQPSRVAARKSYQKTLEGKAAHAKANQRWIDRYPERRSASHAVNNAVRDGKLQKLPCFICGADQVEAHHPAYSMPLVVTWLCEQHHKEIHWHMDMEKKAA